MWYQPDNQPYPILAFGFGVLRSIPVKKESFMSPVILNRHLSSFIDEYLHGLTHGTSPIHCHFSDGRFTQN